MEIAAAAEAEKARLMAKGEADALLAKMEAQARGAQEILTKQAEGFAQIVAATGGYADQAVKLMIADKLEELVRIQVEAIKNIKIDKVTVWDGAGGGSNGNTSTANFLSGMAKAIPPMNELFNMAGMELPELLGKGKPQAPAPAIKDAPAPAEEPATEPEVVAE